MPQSPADPASGALFPEMRDRARVIFDHALAECGIPQAFSRKLQCRGRHLQSGNEIYDLRAFERILVVSIGKAGHSMAEVFANIVDTGLTGIIAAPTAPPAQLFGFRYFTGGHPLPNDDSLRAGDAILRLVHGLSPETLAVFLISGGASAIAEKPISDGITLQDVVETYRALVHSGAPIAEINAIRKHLSAVKGGRLAQAAYPAQQVSILVSDVPDATPDALASGPTMPDSTSIDDCERIAAKYNLVDQFPSSVTSLFRQHALDETPKSDDPAFVRARWWTVLSNKVAIDEAAAAATRAGFAVEVDNSCDDWPYDQAAAYLLNRLQELRSRVSRICLISGGEVTVTVRNGGIGGRNQQFALACAEPISGQDITVLSAGTDGIDGNSPAAGAVVDGSTLDRSDSDCADSARVDTRARGTEAARQALSSFNAYPFFGALGDTIITGPTGNNLRDLRILLAY